MQEAILMFIAITLLTSSSIFRGTQHKKQVNVMRITKAIFISNCVAVLFTSLLYYNPEITQEMRLTAIKQLWGISVLSSLLLIGMMIYQYRKRPAELSTPHFLIGYLPIAFHCFAATFFVSRFLIDHTQG